MVYTGEHATYDEEHKENRMTTAEREAFTPWKQFFRGVEQQAKDPTRLSPRSLAFYVINTAIPPSRVKDCQLMKVAGPDTELDPAATWLYLSKAGMPVRMEINQYKTSNDTTTSPETTFRQALPRSS